MKPKRVILMDTPNIELGARDAGIALDYSELLDFSLGGDELQLACAYLPPGPYGPRDFDADAKLLRNVGWRVTTRPSGLGAKDGTYKQLDVQLALDAYRLAASSRPPHTIALLSGDLDFLPMVELATDLGVRVEVFSFAGNLSRDLAKAAHEVHLIESSPAVRASRATRTSRRTTANLRPRTAATRSTQGVPQGTTSRPITIHQGR